MKASKQVLLILRWWPLTDLGNFNRWRRKVERLYRFGCVKNQIWRRNLDWPRKFISVGTNLEQNPRVKSKMIPETILIARTCSSFVVHCPSVICSPFAFGNIVSVVGVVASSWFRFTIYWSPWWPLVELVFLLIGLENLSCWVVGFTVVNKGFAGFKIAFGVQRVRRFLMTVGRLKTSKFFTNRCSGTNLSVC